MPGFIRTESCMCVVKRQVIYTLQWNEQKFEGKYLFYPRLFPRILWSAVPLRAASSVYVIGKWYWSKPSQLCKWD